MVVPKRADFQENLGHDIIYEFGETVTDQMAWSSANNIPVMIWGMLSKIDSISFPRPKIVFSEECKI